MRDLVRHAFKLESIGAPLEARAMGMLAAWQATRLDDERSDWTLAEAEFAWNSLSLEQHPARAGRPLPPWISQLRALDAGVTWPLRFEALGLPGDGPPALNATFDDDASHAMVLEAMTPMLRSSLSFAKAVAIADHPDSWARATIQMTAVPQKRPALPADGARWRARLRKLTDFCKPLHTNLVCDETIEITATGVDVKESASGSRRYTYFLFESHAQAGRPRVYEDAGWIELSGDENGSQVQIKKRVRLSRPTDAALRRLLAAGFLAELWLWAAGFYEVAGGADPRPAPPRLPPTVTKLVVQMPGKPAAPATGTHGKMTARTPPPRVRIAILGAGPAGLACAWLLSNPTIDGKPAWKASANGAPPILDLTVVEQHALPGGKAASVRRADSHGGRRIEEHGLHVLMGFYTNVLALVKQLGTESLLVDTPTLRVPAGAAPGDVASALEIAIQPWEQRVAPAPAPPPGADLQRAKVLERSFVAMLDRSTESARRPLLRGTLFLGRQVQHLLESHDNAPPAIESPFHADVLRGLVKSMQWNAGGGRVWDSGETPTAASLEQMGAMARMLRQLARAAMSDPDGPGDRLAAEALELGTTILSGLQEHDLLPTCAIAEPGRLGTDVGLADWALSLQAEFDGVTIREWLEQHGIARGFVSRSRLLAALTAGLFTTPDGIAAGTFIHGAARLALDFQGAPFKRMRGGTGEVLIAPMYEALNAKGVTFLFRTKVDELIQVAGSDPPRIESVSMTTPVRKASDTLFVAAPSAHWARAGWTAPAQGEMQAPTTKARLEADSYVLALPPFGGPLPGLPEKLAESLRKIGHRATVALQQWTDGDPRYPSRIVAPLPDPMRCAAAMEHLTGDEGANVCFPPVYYCGDLDDETARAFAAQGWKAWLAANGPSMQGGARVGEPFVSANIEGSARYVAADPDTQACRRGVEDSEASNLWLAGDWTKGALSCGSIEHAVTSGLEAAASILRSLDCTVDYPIVGSALPTETPKEGA
jgi:uncharacterized protein with NAD-binding domain and iron-sulfur cluster